MAKRITGKWSMAPFILILDLTEVEQEQQQE
jgi:hypothetical protein